jgi:hypothetical protein
MYLSILQLLSQRKASLGLLYEVLKTIPVTVIDTQETKIKMIDLTTE